MFPLRSILFFSLPPPLLLFLFLRFGPWSGAATRVARIPETRTGRGGEKTIPRLIVVACSPLVSHASRFYSPRRFNAQQRGSSDLFHFDRGGRGDKRRSRCRALPAFAYQLRGIPFDARRKRRNRKNAWNRDGELMGETRIFGRLSLSSATNHDGSSRITLLTESTTLRYYRYFFDTGGGGW